MTPPRRRGRLRTRLAISNAVLFLFAGMALLALTYTLVSRVLLPGPAQTKVISPKVGQVLNSCKMREAPGQPAIPEAFVQRCNQAAIAAGFGPEQQRGRTLRAVRDASLIGLGILPIVAIGLAWLTSGRALRPVRALTEAAREASELRLGRRLAFTGPDDELGQLADTFDVMLERLDAAFTSQKRFVANAAHELRTPLTAMRTAIEVTLSKPARTPAQLEAMALRVRDSVHRAEATIEALLTLATSEAGPATREPVDLASVAGDALDAAQAGIAERGIAVEASLAPAPTRGDRVLIERMIANLVENAVRHNTPDGWIGVRTVQQDGRARFEIANTGATVCAEQIPSLFEPFARVQQRVHSHDGVGLGLSIATAIARVHDAALTAHPRDGGGLEMSVTLPGG
jgi:signal transduction histidine kinase